MIFTIKSSNFSGSNVGTLNTVIVKKTIDQGVSHSVPNFVEKGAAINWVLTLREDYELAACTVSMGGAVITPNIVDGVITINIPAVSGPINVLVTSTYVGVIVPDTPDEEPETPDTNTEYYKLCHGNIYSKGFTEQTNRASIQPAVVMVNSGVTVTPKQGYLMGHYDVDISKLDDLTTGSSMTSQGGWVATTYTGTGTYKGFTIKKDTDEEFNFEVDSIYAADYFDVSDPSIWIVKEIGTPTPETPDITDPSDIDLNVNLEFGNPYGTGDQLASQARAHSVKAIYCPKGTVISINDNVNYKWAVAQCQSDDISDRGTFSGYKPDPVWTSKKSYTTPTDGWWCFIVLKADSSNFDWSVDSNNVITYFSVS